ncbi:MAG TPA: heavy-metal-associated domain-containing protein [Coriobacteriia bacterium]
MSEATARLKTTGMHCSSCSMLVDLTLGELPGVSSSKTDHASGDTVVSYDPEIVGVESMIEAIRSVGYDAEQTV